MRELDHPGPGVALDVNTEGVPERPGNRAFAPHGRFVSRELLAQFFHGMTFVTCGRHQPELGQLVSTHRVGAPLEGLADVLEHAIDLGADAQVLVGTFQARVHQIRLIVIDADAKPPVPVD